MHIRKIVIENIRCFDRVELDLTRPDGTLAGWTVLAGRNGAGKSTLLKAIALAVAGPRIADKLQTSFEYWIRNGSERATVEITLKAQKALPKRQPGTPLVPIRTGGDFIPVVPLELELRTIELKAALSWKREVQEEPSMTAEVDQESRDVLEGGPWHLTPWSDFLAAYGPFRRIGFRDTFQPLKTTTETRIRSLFDEDATLAESIQWLKDIRALRLDFEDRARRATPEEAEKLEIQAEREARLYERVLAFLNDGLLPDNVVVIGLDMQRGLIIKQDGNERLMQSLSDGYRAGIALVLDIIRQMHRTFPSLFEMEFAIESAVDTNGKAIVQIPYEGVVLIDEVDAHLHVSWQQRIGFWLKKHFPNVQFIVTTHSPFVCQAADPKGLIRLPVPGSNERVEHVSEDLYYTVVNGDADDAVMTALFGLERPHSEQAEKLRSRIAKLEVKDLRGLATPEEKEELTRLSAQLPKTGNAVVEQALRKLGEMG